MQTPHTLPDETPGRQFADREFLDAVREHDPAATREVAEAVGVTRQGADYRLRQLRDEGRVRSKTVGRELVWMLVK